MVQGHVHEVAAGRLSMFDVEDTTTGRREETIDKKKEKRACVKDRKRAEDSNSKNTSLAPETKKNKQTGRWRKKVGHWVGKSSDII